MKLLIALIWIVLFAFYFSRDVLAVITVEINNVPQSINKDDEVVIDVNLQGVSAGSINYLRAAFYSEGTDSYFGYILNHENEWYNGSPVDPKKFMKIVVGEDKSWVGQIKIKPDLQSNHYNGNGNYKFKIGRYTENGTSVSTWSDEFTISLTGNQPTPTISPTPTKSPTSTPTPKPTKVPTPTPTLKPTEKQEPTSKITSSQVSRSVYGTTSSIPVNTVSMDNKEEIDQQNLPKQEVEEKEQIISSKYRLPILAGVLFLCSGCGILAFQKYKKDKETEI